MARIVEEYLNKIKPYLNDVIIYHQEPDTLKIQLTIGINFISSKDLDEKRVMHSNNNNIHVILFFSSVQLIK